MASVRVVLRVVLMMLALVCFFLAALNVSSPRGNLIGAGLFLLTLAMVIA